MGASPVVQEPLSQGIFFFFKSIIQICRKRLQGLVTFQVSRQPAFVSLTVWLQSVSFDSSAQLQIVSSPAVCQLWPHTVSGAGCVQLDTFRRPAMCQPSFVSAQLRSDSCTSNCRLGNLSALAAAGQLSCSFSAWLPRSQSTSGCQLRCTPFSPAAVF